MDVEKDEQTLEFIKFSEQEIAKFKEFGRNKRCYERLVDVFAPSIWENDDVKKGVICQLFGGSHKNFSQSGRGRFRGEINVLLVGDPSTAKSQILQYVHKIAPRGIYTSGKGSSAVGLTAYVTKDPETRENVLESGALVLSDKGICCIDEFDKMSESTRVILHEAMEQQTVSIAKAGIICTLNARTAVLAAANPIDSKYNAKRSVVDNIRLPPTLLSRFDLIYLMLDKQNTVSDRRLASHIVSLYGESAPDVDAEMEGDLTINWEEAIDREFLSKYISYSRKYCNPEISEAAGDALAESYLKMRSIGSAFKTITATPRQLESLIRISEAHARIRLSKIVEKADVQEAERLIQVATQQAATDPTTGKIDMDIIASGVSAQVRESAWQIGSVVKELLRADTERGRKGVQYLNLFEEVKRKAIAQGIVVPNEVDYRNALKDLEE